MKSLKIRLELNNKQTTKVLQHCGVARHSYNWGIDVCVKAFENKEKLPSAIDLHKKLVAEVKSANAWYYESSKCAPQQALRNLNTSYQNFFRNHKNGTIAKKKAEYIKNCKAKGREVNNKHLFNIGKPKFKKRGLRDNFYLEGAIHIKGNKIKLPILGWLKCSEIIPDCEIKNVVVSRVADEWFVSFKIPHEPIPTVKTKGVQGVDLGIKTLATVSDGTTFANPKAFRSQRRKLAMEQRKLSKKHDKTKNKKEQSNNYRKQKIVVAKKHATIANIRKDAIHKATTYLAKNHSEIVIEDLAVSNMMKNHKLANAIADGGLHEFRRQLVYKCGWYGCVLTVVDRFYPSSKLCSCCGNKKEDLKLSDRMYHCDKCGLTIDRDLNASINLRKKAVSYSHLPVESLIPLAKAKAGTQRSRKQTAFPTAMFRNV